MKTDTAPDVKPSDTSDDDIHTIDKTLLGEWWAIATRQRLIALCGKDVTNTPSVSVWDPTTCATCAVLERAM